MNESDFAPDAMSDDHHFLRTDRASHWRHVAEHVSAHPADLEIALENIRRWLDWGRTHPSPILEWRRRIVEAQSSPAAFEEFIDYLAEDNHETEALKSCSPFAGPPFADDTIGTTVTAL